ncbi:hypothetical protein Ciccas_000147 [Cichlidogyrus casuarinus]|uniref:Uncharacterized protein n=1 Tax=Cichlidogyrus casuarinus TaxID=1844966 RepID=A0ABD2QNP7_9PLAT
MFREAINLREVTTRRMKKVLRQQRLCISKEIHRDLILLKEFSEYLRICLNDSDGVSQYNRRIAAKLVEGLQLLYFKFELFERSGDLPSKEDERSIECRMSTVKRCVAKVQKMQDCLCSMKCASPLGSNQIVAELHSVYLELQPLENDAMRNITRYKNQVNITSYYSEYAKQINMNDGKEKSFTVNKRWNLDPQQALSGQILKPCRQSDCKVDMTKVPTLEEEMNTTGKTIYETEYVPYT